MPLGEWNLDFLKRCFDNFATRVILQIIIPTQGMWFWALTTNGKFIVQSLYQDLIRMNTPYEDGDKKIA
ncbi:hypothetical protein PanWU01x14_015650 [Parasponia andersonii]|uniref:Uncharacterized protein n=1 Tax=Parasponia andersonii TaxID=3476 RepID=A0A2P5E0J2_PARAD|nr:hypothetical protein PanWU01x14_015650 [Parasponia andersonii]